MRSTAGSLLWMRMPVLGRVIALLGTAVLVGCEGTVTLDVATTVPADPAITQVLVDLEGIELGGSGGTETILFDEPERMDLLDFANGSLFRLLTEEELEDGRYTSARLLFAEDEDEDDLVQWSDGREFDLTVADGAPADVDFTVDQDDSSRDNIVLTLDLRQSLSFDDNSRVYTLTPLLRGVSTEDTGQIAGNVTIDCPSGSPLQQGGAVYLFRGEDVTPEDRGAASADPYLTTFIEIDVGTGGIASYTFSFIPEGDYTIAATCNGDEDDAATNDDIRFEGAANVRVRAEETTTHNFE